MISVEEALDRCFALVVPVGVETVPLRHACGRILAEPVVARRDQPPFPASAMDGYAVPAGVKAGDRFSVVGEAGAGHAFAGLVEAGQAVRIFTGAPVPRGAGHVVIQEDVDRHGDVITVRPTVDAGTNIRAAGQDFAAGSRVEPRLLRPNDLCLLAAMNIPLLPVRRSPVVAIIATGDELVMPGEEPADDQIIASNAFTLAALVEEAGAEARILPIARDREADLMTVLTLAEGADLIVTIGGASVGDHDLVGRVAESMGMERAFYKIAMRPGKPLMAGRLRGVPMLGLPGNPVSSIVCGHLFLLPMVKAMLGLPALPPARAKARLAVDVPANGPREHYMRARLKADEALPLIMPFDRQDSALITILTEADALLIRPLGDGPRQAGTVVDYLPL